MNLAHVTDTIPLETDEHGVIRVGRTRVTLDTVLAAFAKGASAEEIVHQYDALELADVYAVIAYYLRHRIEVDDYLTRQNALRQAIRKDNELRFDANGIRARLLARRSAK